MKKQTASVARPASLLLTVLILNACRSADQSRPSVSVAPAEAPIPEQTITSTSNHGSVETSTVAATRRPEPRFADHLLSHIRGKRIMFRGYIKVTGREPETKIGLMGLLDVNESRSTASYRLMDSSGRTLEILTIERSAAGTKYAYGKGDSTASNTEIDLDAHLYQTDATWGDLALDYLWWDVTNVKSNATDRGQPCDIVVLTPPPSVSTASASVHVWLMSKRGTVLRISVHNDAGTCIREAIVKSYYRKTGLFGKLSLKRPGKQGSTTIRIEKYEEVDAKTSLDSW